MTLLRLARWINFIKQLLLPDMDLDRLKKTAVINWHPKGCSLVRGK